MTKILLADDSLIMHRAVKLCLKKEPFEVITTDNGKDALALILQHRPAVVLADLDMQGMSGAELCKAIREDERLKDTRFILLCGSFEQVDEARLAGIPADARLWKPFEAHVLISLLNSFMKEKHLSSGIRTGADPTEAVIRTNLVERNIEITAPMPLPPLPKSPTRSDDDFAQSLTKETFQEVSPLDEVSPPVLAPKPPEQDFPKVSEEFTSEQLWGDSPQEADSFSNMPDSVISPPSLPVNIALAPEPTESSGMSFSVTADPFDYVDKSAPVEDRVASWLDDKELKTEAPMSSDLMAEEQTGEHIIPQQPQSSAMSADEAQIRRMIQEEIDRAMTRNLKQILEEQLQLVIAEIESV